MADVTQLGKCVICGSPVKRKKNKTCSKECMALHMSRLKTGTSKPGRGGRVTDPFGYVYVRIPGHHRIKSNGYVAEHIVVMEEKLGRQLDDKEVVHHINGNRGDNRPENLELYPSSSEHTRLHHLKYPPFCSCGKPHWSHGLCLRHYMQQWRTGRTWDLDPHGPCEPRKCFCGQETRARGMCNLHYQRWYDENVRKPRRLARVG